VKDESTDLREQLFLAMERINDDDLTPEQIAVESVRGRTLVDLAMQITASAALDAKAYDLFDGSFGKKPLPKYFRKALAGLEEAKSENETNFVSIINCLMEEST
jgi:hypothetical protein